MKRWVNKTGLLVSVRNQCEALVAVEHGASIIDIKEPTLGSLGPANRSVVADILNTVQQMVPVSVACGELLGRTDTFSPHLAQLEGIQFAKVGLAGAAATGDWRTRLLQIWETWPQQVQRIAVCYVDVQIAISPSFEEILTFAVQHHATGILWDTFDKTGPGLTGHVAPHELKPHLEQAKSHGLLTALAGQLTFADIAILKHLTPNLFAVRGAACQGVRTQGIDAACVRQLAQQLLPQAC